MSCLGSEGRKSDIKLSLWPRLFFHNLMVLHPLWNCVSTSIQSINVAWIIWDIARPQKRWIWSLKERISSCLKEGAVWVRQEWNFWVPSLESQEIKEAMRENRDILPQLSSSAALPLAKYRWIRKPMSMIGWGRVIAVLQMQIFGISTGPDWAFLKCFSSFCILDFRAPSTRKYHCD